jgi:hypothetical protein
VNILQEGKRCEKLCGDLLTMQQRKCTLKKISNLWVKLCNLCKV